MLGFKCEWLNLTSTTNEKIGGAEVYPSLDQIYDVGTQTWGKIVRFQVWVVKFHIGYEWEEWGSGSGS
jgi:hypothetical protein